MSSILAIKSKNKIKKFKHNRNQNSQKSTENKESNYEPQNLTITDTKNEGRVNSKEKKIHFFEVFAKKVRICTLESKECLKENKRKIENAFNLNKPRVINKILAIARSFHEKISALPIFNNKSINELKSKAFFEYVDTKTQTCKAPLEYQPKCQFQPELDALDISFIQFKPESSSFSYKPKDSISYTHNKFDSSEKIQKLMLLNVKPSAKLQKLLKESPKKIQTKGKFEIDTFSSNKSTTIFKKKNEYEMKTRPVEVCECNHNLDAVANNLVMLKWVSYEQHLGEHNPANFTTIARHILTPNVMERYLRRKKEVEDAG